MELASGYSMTLVFVAVLIVVFIGLVVYIVIWTKMEKPVGGREGLVGEIGVASTDINPNGSVLVHGEWWNAQSDAPIAKGEQVRVVEAKKMLLKVEKSRNA